MTLTSAQMTTMGIALAACYAAFKFSGNQTIKAAAVAVGAVIVGKQVPFIQDALA